MGSSSIIVLKGVIFLKEKKKIYLMVSSAWMGVKIWLVQFKEGNVCEMVTWS